MTYDDLIILIPSHSLEDFPTDIGEEDASSLLNAFAVVWHPVLLAEAGVLPSWHRADDPPEALENRLIIVPAPSEEWLQGGWADHARKQGAVVITGTSDRDEMLQAALEPLLQQDVQKSAEDESSTIDSDDSGKPGISHSQETEETVSEESNGNGISESSEKDASENEEETAENSESIESESADLPPADESVGPSQKTDRREVDPELAADFLALGTCYLQIELLTRHMHHFSNFDEVHLQREAVSAAQAALADDAEAARSHLKACFELLTEARERFYPVDCYLIDLCLLIPRLADEHLEKTLSTRKPINILVTAEDLQKISVENPQVFNSIREGWEAGIVNLIGGEWQERPTSVIPLESVLWNFQEGHSLFRKLMERTPTTWGRRRFGFTTQIPQILNKFGYHSALHIALDDGVYPDEEQSKIRWEGSDGTVVDAITRIPLAAESATSFLRYPVRMAESMEEDQVAAVIWARWPEIQSPWFEDFRRIHNYSPTLGRLVTLEEFFEQTDDPGRLSSFEAKDYLSPFLIQSVAREEENPISRYADHLKRRQEYDGACWYSSLAAVLSGENIDDRQAGIESLVEQAGPEADSETVEKSEAQLKQFVSESSQKLAEVILRGGARQPGFLLLNSLSFPRTVSVSIPDLQTPPESDDFIKTDQFDESGKVLRVKIPPCGFVWIPASSGSSERSVSPGERRSGTPLVEGNVLRNKFFEVHINEATGGIERLKEYGRHPNRISQQLAFRFPKERTFVVEEDGSRHEDKSYYSEMICHSLEVTNAGPAIGEITTTGNIIDQQKNIKLAAFRQIFRIWKGRPIVEIEIELDVETMPSGDPWTNYIASRFAWNDSTASLTRSMHQGAHGLGGERFESLHYLEIASDDERTTIINPSSPFFRKTGMRMVDNLLLVAGETKRRFRYTIAVDSNYPMQAALDAMIPVDVVPTTHGPPPTGRSGWFFSLDAKNVQILRIMGPTDEPPDNLEAWEQHDYEQLPSRNGFALRLVETEGRHRQVKLSCFQTPSRARQRDFQGRTIADLTILDDSVIIDMTAYEIADVELLFDDPA